MFYKEERGAAVVEFAVVVPLLLLILFGIIEFSILFYDKAIITNASREAAREWIVYRNVKLTEPQLQDIVDAYTQDRMISLSTTNTPVVVAEPYDGATLVAMTAIDTGFRLKLEVTYTYDFVFLPAFMNSILPTIDLSATTNMRAE